MNIFLLEITDNNYNLHQILGEDKKTKGAVCFLLHNNTNVFSFISNSSNVEKLKTFNNILEEKNLDSSLDINKLLHYTQELDSSNNISFYLEKDIVKDIYNRYEFGKLLPITFLFNHYVKEIAKRDPDFTSFVIKIDDETQYLIPYTQSNINNAKKLVDSSSVIDNQINNSIIPKNKKYFLITKSDETLPNNYGYKISLNELIKVINKIQNIEDKYSKHFFAKRYKLIAWVVIVFLGILAAGSAFLFTQKQIELVSLTSEVETIQTEVSKLDSEIQKNKTNITYNLYKPLDLNKFKEELDFVKTLSVSEYNVNINYDKNTIEIKLNLMLLDDLKKLLELKKDYKITYKIEKENLVSVIMTKTLKVDKK